MPAAERAAQVASEAGRLLAGLLDDDDPQLCLAAVHVLAGDDSGLAVRRMARVVEAVRSPEAEIWSSSSWIEGGARKVASWSQGLYRDGPRAVATFTLVLRPGTFAGLAAAGPEPVG